MPSDHNTRSPDVRAASAPLPTLRQGGRHETSIALSFDFWLMGLILGYAVARG
ncbi:MAG TPA: hypothetical protein VJA28_02950 [Patescibacteria group bacterium]|nr:hypothetical protein [Patescibacteria group bacterium]